MGCRISKSDEPTVPVLLCRERRDLIRATSDHRRALALAHSAYFHSLSRVGDALLQFVQQDLSSISSPSVLTLPPSPDRENVKNPKPNLRKPAPVEKESDLALSDSSISPFHSSCASPGLRPNPDPELDRHCLYESDYEGIVEEENSGFRENLQWLPYAGFTAYPGPSPSVGMVNYHYMKSSSTVPTTVYQHPYGDDAKRVYMDYGYGYNYLMYGFNLPPELVQMQEKEEKLDSESPPPPPPAPTVSGWDFFNLFDSYEQSLNAGFSGGSGSIRSSSNSSEVREREGIPELEEETEQESVKGSSKEQVGSNETGHEETSDVVKNVSESENVVKAVKAEKSTSVREVNTKMKKVKKVSFEEDMTLVAENGGSNSGCDLIVPTGTRGTRDVEEVVREIKEEFGSLVSCGAEVVRLLGDGSMPHRSRTRVLRCGY